VIIALAQGIPWAGDDVGDAWLVSLADLPAALAFGQEKVLAD